MKDLRIVFMGTPDFAVATLGTLLINGYNVVGVVTAPDKPAGRGRQVSKAPVKEYAEFSDLPILQPVNLKDPEFIARLGSLSPDLIIVVAFRMLPEVVWRLPSMGTFNLHASLLPDYRGAAPINHVLINGESITGVTTFFLDDKIDTGNILLREEVNIYPFDSAGDLHDRLMKLGARLVVRTVEGLGDGSIKPQPQSMFTAPGRVLKTAPKIFPADCIIDWNMKTLPIHNLIRGLSPYPGARSAFIKGSTRLSFKIFDSHPEQADHGLETGTIVSDGKKSIRIACSDGFVHILGLQLEGRTRMSAAELLRGFSLADTRVEIS